jgi:putative transposase
MLKTFKYRLRPTKKQERLLQSTLDECRWLYNHFLEQRKTSWEDKKKSLNYPIQAVSIPKLKKERDTLSNVHSQVLQNVAVRIDLARTQTTRDFVESRAMTFLPSHRCLAVVG